MSERRTLDLRNNPVVLRPGAPGCGGLEAGLIPADFVRGLDQRVRLRHIIESRVPGLAAADAAHGPTARTKRRSVNVVGGSTIRTDDVHGRFALLTAKS